VRRAQLIPVPAPRKPFYQPFYGREQSEHEEYHHNPERSPDAFEQREYDALDVRNPGHGETGESQKKDCGSDLFRALEAAEGNGFSRRTELIEYSIQVGQYRGQRRGRWLDCIDIPPYLIEPEIAVSPTRPVKR